MQTDPTASAPKFLGKYEVLARLDSGGMAEIFLARARALAGFEKLVVLKRILPHLAAEEEFVSLFLDEAKTTVALSHGNVVQVFDMGKDADGDYFIAMEYVAGKNLRRFTKRIVERTGKPIDPPLAAFIAAEILKGLDYAHRRTDGTGRPLGIVHRDVSPHNILISYEGEVKLTDFGIAKAAGKVSHTEAGFVRGKANYMSPEQAAAEPLDGRSDLFGVGVLLWEMLTGESLFSGDNPEQVIRQLRSGPVPDAPSRRSAAVPPALDAIVTRALARNAAERYPSADVFLKEIGQYLQTAGAVLGPRDLAQRVTDMFAEEIETERRQIAALPRASSPPVLTGVGENTVATKPLQTLDFETSGEMAITGNTDTRDLARRRGQLQRGGAVLAAVIATAAVFAWSNGWLSSDPVAAPTPAVSPSPSLAPSPSPSPAPSPSPTPRPSPSGTKLTVVASPIGSPVTTPARLSINTNPWGAITIDGEPLVVKRAPTTSTIAGQLRTTTPLQDFAIKPGKHVIRVEQLDPTTGKVLQRGEQTVELVAGESRSLNIPMKPVPPSP